MEGLKNFVVGFDGSPLGELALRRALIKAQAAPFSFIHVVMVVEDTESGCLLPSGEEVPRFVAIETIRLTLKKLVEIWHLENPRARLVAHLPSGPVASTLVDLVERFRADCLFLGAHGSDRPLGRIGAITAALLKQTRTIPVHIEAPSFAGAETRAFDAFEWIYIFGRTPLGTTLTPALRSPPVELS